MNAMTDLTTGDDNTCVGNLAGNSITTGSNNLLLGKGAGETGAPGGAFTTDSNQIVLGNDSSTNAFIKIDWTVGSDKRDKTDVTPLDIGLNFVNKLEPVTYKWDERSKYRDGQTPDGTHKKLSLDVGFLAQDVEKIEAEFGYKADNETNLTTYVSKDKNAYGLTYAKFIPMLTKAIQELSTKVEELENKLKEK